MTPAAERRRQRQAEPGYRAWKKAYDAAKYRANRDRILAQQREYLEDPEVRARHAAYQAAYHGSDEYKAKRRRRYALKRYGTETPPVRPKKERPCRTPRSTPAATRSSTSSSTSRPTTKTASTSIAARAARPSKPTATPSRRSSTASMPASTTVSTATPPIPTKPLWHPQPISKWEPGLDRQAERTAA